ncbi:MAG: hypothetical protein HY721_25080 [Planctomycetes bacterium]|nr:hypothetical protein [Planctomycetota bacterium]
MSVSLHRTLAALCLLLSAGAGLAQDERVALRIRGPEGELSSGGEIGAAVTIDAKVLGVQGWSLGVAHDPQVLELLDAAAGSVTATANNGRKPDFLVVNVAPAAGTGVTMAVVISFTEFVVLPVKDDQEILTMRYKVLADPASVDPCVPIPGTVAFSNDLGTPPVQTIVTLEGSSVNPTRADYAFTVRCPGTLEITRCEGDPDNVYLEWTFGAVEWDFLFLYRDGELLATLDADATRYTDALLKPGSYVYTLITFVVDDPKNPVLIFAHCTATVIPLAVTSVEPRVGYWLGGDVVTVKGTAFTTAEATRLAFVGGPGEPEIPLEVLEVKGPNELTARTAESHRLGAFGIRIENERGSAELADAFEYGFIRGEINSDGKLDLSDSVFLLTYLFVDETAPPPRCFDAADSNDDALVDISDAILVLAYLFVGGPPPKPPFPGPGQDPTTRDRFGCLEAVSP